MAERPSRRRTWGWRTVLVLAWLAVIALFSTGRGWQPQTIDPPLPPFEPPTFVDYLPGTSVVTSLYGRPLELIVSRPPDAKIFTSTAPLANDYRHAAVAAAWWEGWADPVSVGRFEIEVWQMTRLSIKAPLTCKPAADWSAPGATSAGLVWDRNGVSQVCALIQRGATYFLVRTLLVGDDRNERGQQLVQKLAANWVATVPDDSPSATGTVPMPNSQRSLLLAWLVALTVAAGAATVPSLITDRSSWRRLTSRIRRRRPNPAHDDLEPAAQLALSRSAALGVARFALVLGALRLGEEIPLSTSATIAAIAVAFLLGIVGQRLILSRSIRQQNTRLLRGRALVWTVAGMVTAAGVAAAACWLWVLGVTAGSSGTGGADSPDWMTERFGIGSQFVALWVFAASAVPLTLARRLARRAGSSAPASAGPPTLLLRNFTDDNLTLRARRLDRASLADHALMRRREHFEEILAFSLRKHGYPYAVGRPGETLPPALGATRLYYPDERWQAAVRQIADDASLVAVIVGRSQWLTWEMLLLLEAGLLHKTVFVLPPLPSREARKRLAVLREVLDVPWSVFDTRGTGRDALAVCWPLGRARPVVVVSGAGDDLSYDLALDHCADVLTDPALTHDGSESHHRMWAEDRQDAPPSEVLAAGESKATRRWWKRPWLLLLLLNGIVLPFAVPWVQGAPVGGRSTQVEAAALGAVGLLAVHDREVTYLRNGDTVVRQPMNRDDPVELGRLPGKALSAHLVEGVIYAQVLVGGKADYELMALRLSDQLVLWRTRWPQYLQGWAVTQRWIVLPDPTTGSVVSFDRRTGRSGSRGSVPCRPWSTDAVGDKVWVTCPGSDTAIELNPDNLATVRSVKAPRGTIKVLDEGGRAWLLSPLESRLVPADGGAAQIWLVKAMARAAAAEGTLAVQGIERISIFRDNYVDRRLTMIDVIDIMVATNGDVAFLDDRGIIYAHPLR